MRIALLYPLMFLLCVLPVSILAVASCDVLMLLAAAPLLGEHTSEVLIDELGLEPEEINSLRKAGVLR